ncbi:MAG: AIR synthase [Dehalococcoidales bacterium]|nr:AIR synthase [Dehalococcoidales bacterium]
MSEIPEIGKISADIFSEIIFPRLGASSKDVLVGPMHGVDVGIAKIGNKAVSFTTDPVFIVPEYGWERAAWFAINILASDSVTCGLPPRYLSIDLNLPMSMTKQQMDITWRVIHSECERMGINIITGHTGRYENCNYPMVGGGTVIGVGELDQYVSPRFISAGDKIIVTKGPAIEATGIFAAMLPRLLAEKFGSEFSIKAQEIFYKMSVVDDAMTAISVGARKDGITAMHDATECGIWGGLYEVAQAAGLGVKVEHEKIVVTDCVLEICRLFDIDPYASISEGTLIIACRPHKADAVVKALADKGIISSVIGEFTEKREGMVLVKEGKETELKHPIVDPFWNAFYRALEKYKDYL